MGDIVYFLTPSGQKVSNDPRWLAENDSKAREEMLASVPNTGHTGVSKEEYDAQTQVVNKVQLNSGQPGVGENAVPDDATNYTPKTGTGASAMHLANIRNSEKFDSKYVEQGETPEAVDSNKAVKDVREAQEKRRQAALKAQQALFEAGEEEGDTEKPYSEWTAKQLKAEVAKRNAERGEEDQIDTAGVKKKGDLAKLLEADDANRPADTSGDEDEDSDGDDDSSEDDSDNDNE